ncbi:MAG: peptidoglycan DD-metalloendopeptidase family protein [Pikeienuella sp.]|uniref:peptidoglycan DD-metalloendopeptidase family protein n=1 Tax=Pikeienuella sp. TaxID=2831957 RepID=UPI00391935AF
MTRLRLAPLLAPALALFLAACVEERREPAPVVYRTPVAPAPTARPAPPSNVAPAAAPAPAPSGQADARGVVSYSGYETIRARSGDSVDSMAARVGLSAAELAAYNGLSTQYQPREGDELVLPARADRYQGSTVVAAAPQAQTGAAWPEYAPSAPLAAGATPQPAAPTPAPAPGGWSAELAREAVRNAPEPGAVASAPLAAPGESPVDAQPAAPAPEAPVIAAAPQPAPAAAPAPAASAAAFSRPVDAPVSRSFSRAPGPDRNDGVDFATAAGDEVRAAADGEVALISRSLGGLGTIVLLRHDNEFLTVYGRVDGVTVQRGDRVTRGQVIARVADLPPPQGPSLHFEVRRGAESVDPAPYL